VQEGPQRSEDAGRGPQRAREPQEPQEAQEAQERQEEAQELEEPCPGAWRTDRGSERQEEAQELSGEPEREHVQELAFPGAGQTDPGSDPDQQGERKEVPGRGRTPPSSAWPSRMVLLSEKYRVARSLEDQFNVMEDAVESVRENPS